MRIRRHKLGQREETTEELSERVLARLRREYSLVSSEVWVDDVHRVDFVGFRPARNSPFPSSIERGEFVFVEVKSCMNDFKSGHGLTFRGDANWLVCPPDLAQTLYETRQLPKDAAVFCPDARGRLQKKFDLGIGSGSSRIASVSELLFRMVNHSAYSYRTSRGVFSNGYCPWCSPYRAKLLNDIDQQEFSDCVWRNLEPFHGLSFLSPFYLMFVEITVVKYLTWTVENATTLICLILCIKTVFK